MPASKKPTLRRLFVYLAGVLVFLLASPSQGGQFWVGAAIAVAGELLRVWACGHLRKNQAVIQSGPYAHVQNPLYLGTFLILVGCVIAASSLGSASRYLMVLALPFFLGIFFVYYLPHKFEVEGRRLQRKFGKEWEDYNQQVPKFVPRLTPFQRSSVRWQGHLVVENSEVSAALWLVLGLAVIYSRVWIPFPW